jgi:dihydroneopterin aldolase
MSDANVIHSSQIADGHASIQHVFIRDLTLSGLIGVYKHEKEDPQPIRINVDLGVKENQNVNTDRLADVVSYEDIADGIRKLIASGHVNLVETLAQKIVDMCFNHQRVQVVRVRVEKLTVFEDAASAGVEIECYRSV